MFSNLDKDYIRTYYKGNKIGAIRYVREETRAGFKEAKEFVEEIFGDGYSQPQNSNAVPNSQGFYTNSINSSTMGNNQINTYQPANQQTYRVIGSNTDTTNNTNSVDICCNFLWKIVKLIGRVVIALLLTVVSSIVWGIYLFICIGAICVFVEAALFCANMYLSIGNYYNSILIIFIYVYILSMVVAIIYSFIAALMKKNPMKTPANAFNDAINEALKRQEEQRKFDRKMEMLENYRRKHRRNK